MRTSNLSNNLFSSFFLASVPPNSASGSEEASVSLLYFKVRSSRSFLPDVSTAPRWPVGTHLPWKGESSGSDSA